MTQSSSTASTTTNNMTEDALKTIFIADPTLYKVQSFSGTSQFTKAERDDLKSKVYQHAQALMVATPKKKLSLGIKKGADGTIVADVASIARRHVDNQEVLDAVRQRLGEVSCDDMMTVLIALEALQGEVNVTKKYVGCDSLHLIDDIRKLKKEQVVDFGIARASAGLHAQGDEMALYKVLTSFMDTYLKESVDRAFKSEPESTQCALLYFWILLKKILFIDEKTVELLVNWLKNVGEKGSIGFFGGNIAMLGETYISVCKCLVEVNRLPKKAYSWLLTALSKTEWPIISGPFETRLKLFEQQNILEEVSLTVPEAEQQKILQDVETLCKEATSMFEIKLGSNEIALKEGSASMNSFGERGKGGKNDDGLKSSDSKFKGVEVILKVYSDDEYRALSPKQKQLLRIKRKEAGLDPRTGKKLKGAGYRRKEGWSADGESTNLAGGNSGVKISNGKVYLNCKNCGSTTGLGAHTTKYCGLAKDNPSSFPAALPAQHPYHAFAAKCTPVNDTGGGAANQQEGSESLKALTAKVDDLTTALSKMAALNKKVADFEAKETESPERARQYEMLSKAWDPLK